MKTGQGVQEFPSEATSFKKPLACRVSGVSLDKRFNDLVVEHHRAVSAYARALCADRHLAEDAVQETFLRAWRYLDTHRSSGSFEGWLLTICRRCVIDLVRLDKRQVCPVDLPVSSELPDASADVLDLIGELPLAQREVLVLCGWLGYEYQDAAVLLGVPVGTVRSRLHRARVALGEIINAVDQMDQAESAWA